MKVNVKLMIIGGLCTEALHKCNNPYVSEFLKTSIANVCARTTDDVAMAHNGILYSSETEGRSIFDVISDAGKEGVIYSSLDELKAENVVLFENDEEVIDAVMKREEQADFTLICLGDADRAGHKYGFMSEEYLKAVSNAFDLVKRVRDAYPFNKFMVMSDRGGHGKVHESGVASDMYIPVILNRICGVKDKIDTATVFDIAPTVARMLGTEAYGNWKGESFV